MKIKTDSLEPGEPKDPGQSTLFEIYQAFATAEQSAAIRQRYAEGIAWGEMKQLLFAELNDLLAPARERYDALLADPGHVENELCRGGERARDLSAPFMDAIRRAVGIRPLN